MKWQIGDRINNVFEILDIKKGGQGIVYIMFDHNEKVPSALKTYPIDYYEKRKNFKEEFYRECATWSRLGFHPNITLANSIVKLEDGRPYLGLEYVNGGNLKDFIQEFSFKENFKLFLQLCLDFCEGMIHATKHGILAHNDIKPSNLLLTDSLRLKLTDFGLSFVKDKFSNAKTIQGTLPYMAPEAFIPNYSKDIRSDIYSFGITMYEMIEQSLPFLGEDLKEFQNLHKHRPLPRLDIDQDLFDIIKCCTNKNPQERYLEIVELKNDLQNVLYKKFNDSFEPFYISPDYINHEVIKSSQAVSLIEIGEYDDAIKICKELIQDSKDTKRLSLAWNDLGWAISEKTNDYSKSIHYFATSTKINPNNEIAWHNLGLAYRVLNDIPNSIKCYETSIKLNPNYLRPYNNLAFIHVTNSQFKKAEDLLLRALKINPYYLQTNINLAAIYKSHLKNKDKFIYHIKKILAIEPWDEDAILFLTSHYIETLKYDKARELFDRLLSLNKFKYQSSSNFCTNGALIYNRLGEFEKAMKFANRALEIDDLNFLALMEIAFSFKNLDNNSSNIKYTSNKTNEKLISIYNQVININPKYHEAYRLKGIALTCLGRFEESINVFKKATEINPSDANVLNDLGLSYGKIKDFENAISSCIKAIELDSQNEMFYYNLADYYIDLENYELSIIFFRKAVKLRSNYPEAWHSLGLCYMYIDNYEMSEQCYRMTLVYSPSHRYVWHNLGNLNLKVKNFEEAIKCFENAIKIYTHYNDVNGINYSNTVINAIKEIMKDKNKPS